MSNFTITPSNDVVPVLFYDFNSPPAKGNVYWCLRGMWVLPLGHRVSIGSDDLFRYGRVVRLRHKRSRELIGVELEAVA